METEDYKVKIGNLIQESRLHRGYTQAQLAEALNTSQSAINRIEKGGQNISLEMIARISDVLSHDIMTINHTGKTNFRRVARIEEVNRIIEVLISIGVKVRWLNEDNDLEIIPPKRLKLEAM